MIAIHRRHLALAALLTLPCLAQAQGSPATASARLTDLTYELIDLAPVQGEEAWVMFAGPLLSYGVSDQLGSKYKSTSVMPAVTNDSVTAGFDNYAQVTMDKFVTSASVGASQLPPDAPLTHPTSYLLDQRSASIFRYASMDAEPNDNGVITLGPHSKIVMEGKAVGTVFASARDGVVTVDHDPVTGPYTLTANSAATVRFGFIKDFFDSTIVEGVSERVTAVDVFDSRNPGQSGEGVSKSFEKPWRVVLENPGSEEMYAIFEVGVFSSASTTFATSAVPEPSAWGLALAGALVAAGGAMSKRRRPAA